MCRLCGSYQDTVHHMVAGCKMLAGREYLQRHNNTLMVLAIEWAKQEELIDQQTVWYKKKWEQGKVLENKKAKLIWDFEYRVKKKTNEARRPHLVLEKKEDKVIWLCDMAYPKERNIEAKSSEKITKSQQLAYETREKRKDYEVEVIPLII